MTRARQHREKLIVALRNIQAIQDFTFNFGIVLEHDEEGCGTTGCAMGLAAVLWPRHKNMLTDYMWYADAKRAKFFGLTQQEAGQIFWGDHPSYEAAKDDEITPALVADALEAAPYV